MIGTTISHYKILSKIGAGGMGEVFLAEDTKLQRKVALKFLPAAIEADTEARERLIREAQATSKLNHPNILTIYSVEEADGRHFIVMEYITGNTLDQHVKNHRPSVDEILTLAVPIAEGLSKAHQAGIVHRDLKPANVLVDEDGRPRILDFGLAKIEGAAKLTQAGSTIGTVAYSSPEMAQGKESDPRSDIFSFGVMLYEMIAGRLPFEGEHEAAMVYAITNEQPEPLARYKSDVSAGLQHLLSKCLHKDPAERYQSAADLLADMRHELRLSQVPTSHASGVAPPAQKKSRAGLILGLSLAGVVALVLLVLKPWNIEIQPTQEAQASRQMIAVLPFKNLGSAEDEYFADGITDEVITRLASISGLGVISRNSSMKYKGTDLSLQEIGSELGVQHILEGTIRYDHSVSPPRARVSPQLIRVEDDTPVWAETFDRTLDEIFKVQSDIAGQVASELEVTLLAQEQEAIEDIPTDNPEAYNYYLRALYYHRLETTRESAAESMRYFKMAIEADSSFALAWAWLGLKYSFQFHNGWDLSDGPLLESRKAIDKALALAPDDYRVHIFDGFHHYHNGRDYKRALQSLDRAEQFNPTDRKADLYAWIWRRQGKHRQAADLIAQSISNDPKNRFFIDELSWSLYIMRNFDEALKRVNAAIAIHPEDPWIYQIKWRILIGHGNRMDEARSTLAEAGHSTSSDIAYSRFLQDLYDRQWEQALSGITTNAPEFIKEQERALPSQLLQGFVLQYLGRIEEAKAAFEKSKSILADKLSEQPDDSRLHSSLGLALAGLGQTEAAIASGIQGTQLNPIERDAMEGIYRVEDLAHICALVGQLDPCVDALERLARIPSQININNLKLDPRWDPVREHPRFKALIAAGDVIT